jgi:hypothetical protein
MDQVVKALEKVLSSSIAELRTLISRSFSFANHCLDALGLILCLRANSTPRQNRITQRIDSGGRTVMDKVVARLSVQDLRTSWRIHLSGRFLTTQPATTDPQLWSASASYKKSVATWPA